ncbi:unnamed protein product [Aureobasidium pullulans]|nr:unnamed protein product [Aureobasidium pullulans]
MLTNPEDRDPYIQFSRRLVRILKETKPPVSALTKTDSIPATGFNDNKSKSLKRPDYVPITPAEVEGMRVAHQVMVREMSNLTLPFKQGSRGIVSTAGGAHLPIFILFLRADEARGDNYLCQELLPSLNARCVILDDFFPSGLVKLEKYQYKIFSVLFSSFGEVLLLDADNFPVHNVDHVFKTEPFTTTGLVTWPDFWISSASEKFYKIQGKPVPSTNVRASTESGQVLVNKQTHSTALLVSTYYNFYGPSHYYPLLTQGGPVSEPVKILGYDDNGELRGVAMLQSNPVDDYIALVKPLPFTIHANFPKMDPNTLFNQDGPAINHRTEHIIKVFGVDDDSIYDPSAT